MNVPLPEPDAAPPPDARDLRAVVPDVRVVDPDARSLARRVVRPVLRSWLRLVVEDEHHVPTAGPVIIASTHASHADSMALGSALVRPVFFLGDLRLTRWPLLGRWLPRLGMVPVRRGDRDSDALDQLHRLLAEGHAVVVYPEGSRSRDGRVHRPRSGVARLAVATGVPVVPVAVAGTHAVWPTGTRPRLRGGRVHIRFGPPIAPPGSSPAARRAFSEELHTALVELSGAGRAEGFAPVGGGDA